MTNQPSREVWFHKPLDILDRNPELLGALTSESILYLTDLIMRADDLDQLTHMYFTIQDDRSADLMAEQLRATFEKYSDSYGPQQQTPARAAIGQRKAVKPWLM